MGKIVLPHDHGTNTSNALSYIPEEENLETSAFLFSLISDQTRLRILLVLCHSEECVINIASLVNMSPPAVSHHLRLLKNAGIISSRKVGKEVHYKLAENPKAKLMHSIIDATFNINH